jgi:hypothetical protein
MNFTFEIGNEYKVDDFELDHFIRALNNQLSSDKTKIIKFKTTPYPQEFIEISVYCEENNG